MRTENLRTRRIGSEFLDDHLDTVSQLDKYRATFFLPRKMDFDDVLDNCQQIESTIQVLVKANASKQSDISKLETEMLLAYNHQQKQLTDLEHKFQAKLAGVQTKSEKLELEIKLVNSVNEELSEVVKTAQKASRARTEASKKNNQSYNFMGGVIENLDDIRANFKRISDEIQSLDELSNNDSQRARELLEENKSSAIEFHKNANLIRLMEKQGTFAEQQFDMILNQIPWEPLTAGYIKELRGSSNENVRIMADNLALQVSEIQDLEESLVTKKEKKLEILKNLTEQLDVFVRKRSEAILIESRAIRK